MCKSWSSGTSLVVQWLKLHFQCRGPGVWSQVRKLDPECCNYDPEQPTTTTTTTHTHTHTHTQSQAPNLHGPGRELWVVCPIHRWQNGIDGHAGTPSQKWNDSQTWDLNQYTGLPLVHLPHRQYCFSKHTGRATCQALCQLLSVYCISFNSHNSFMRKVLPDSVPILQMQKRAQRD